MIKTLSNEELRDIEYQRAEDDEDIRDLLAFVRHLKRKLGKAQRHIDEQCKHLNAIRIKETKATNIRFEDWEAEQMRDPEFRAAAEELEAEYQHDAFMLRWLANRAKGSPPDPEYDRAVAKERREFEEILGVSWRSRLFYRWLGLTSILRYLMTGHCGYSGCGYVEPYGFVPEAGCPVHDMDTRLSQWARKARKGREQSPWRI